MIGDALGLLLLLAGALFGIETLWAGGSLDAAGLCVLAGAVAAGFVQSR